MALEDTLAFLNELRSNNRKEWFQENRDRYDEARYAFEDFIADLISRFPKVDAAVGALDPKKAIFRINRDIRFSKDKSPYNTHMSALIGRDGRKSTSNYYYISVEPRGESMVASGLKSPEAATLQRIREAIAADAQPLRDIIEGKQFQQTFGELQGEQLKSAPKGFSKDHPDIDLLRFKEYLALRRFTDAAVVDDDFSTQVIHTCLAAKPLSDYLDQLLR